MGSRSGVFAGAVVLLWALDTRADAGLPRFSTPDWSSLSTPQWAGVGLALTLTFGWLGAWAIRSPAAAMGSLVWLLGLPFLLIGASAVAFAVGFRAMGALPFAAVGLGVAAGSAFAGYKVMKANGEWSGRAVVPGLVGLSALALILGLTVSALSWIEPPGPLRPGAKPPAAPPAVTN